MNITGMPEGFVADPEWLQGIAQACRHTVDLIHARYEEKPKGLTMEEIAQLNIASAYLYLYNSALLKDDIAVTSAEDIVWH